MKRTISLLLLLCFVLTAFIACAGETNATEGSTENDPAENTDGHTREETNPYGDQELIHTINIDEHNYDGESITMLMRDTQSVKREFGSETSSEEINEQIITRNEQVANDLNIVIIPEYLIYSSYDDCVNKFSQRIRTDVDSGMHTVDIVAHYAYAASVVDVRERSANLLDEIIFPHFNFTLPCWNQTIVKNSNINGKSLVCAGDMTLSLFNYAYVMWHNKTLYEKVRNKQEDPANMQDCVLAGEWTSDKLYKWSSIYQNSSANDECDTYGVFLAGKGGIQVDVAPFAWKLDLMITNADGTHAYNIVGNRKAEEAVVLFRKITEGQGNAFKHNCNTGNCFIAGNIVFQASNLSSSAEESEQLRAMDDTYALMPFPKFDELQMGRQMTEIEQKLGIEDMGYYSTTQDCYSLIGVLDHSESSVPTKGDMISAYLQHTAELSYADVRGYYFEKVIRGKNFGLDDTDGTVTNSIRIFNMIVNNLQFDYWVLYSASLGDIMWLFRDTTIATNETLEATYTRTEAKYSGALESVEKWFGLIE